MTTVCNQPLIFLCRVCATNSVGVSEFDLVEVGDAVEQRCDEMCSWWMRSRDVVMSNDLVGCMYELFDAEDRRVSPSSLS